MLCSIIEGDPSPPQYSSPIYYLTTPDHRFRLFVKLAQRSLPAFVLIDIRRLGDVHSPGVVRFVARSNSMGGNLARQLSHMEVIVRLCQSGTPLLSDSALLTKGDLLI